MCDLLLCFFYKNLGPPRAKSLRNGVLVFLLSRRKIEPVTTHKMASHLMHMNDIFQENIWLMLIIINTLKWLFLWGHALTQNRDFFFFKWRATCWEWIFVLVVDGWFTSKCLVFPMLFFFSIWNLLFYCLTSLAQVKHAWGAVNQISISTHKLHG